LKNGSNNPIPCSPLLIVGTLATLKNTPKKGEKNAGTNATTQTYASSVERGV
jgi:hypothetical protein